MVKILRPDEIIDRVSSIRTRNNILWMNVLKLAFKENPYEARRIMRQISKNDKDVTKWLAKL